MVGDRFDKYTEKYIQLTKSPDSDKVQMYAKEKISNECNVKPHSTGRRFRYDLEFWSK